MIFCGTGLNFGNDPFATVGEGGDTDEGKVEAAEEEGLEGIYKNEEKEIEGGEARRSSRHRRGQERRGPINRRALSQSRKTAKLHLPF